MEEPCKFSLQHQQLKLWLPQQLDDDHLLGCQEVLQEEEAEVLPRRDGDAPDVQDAPGVPAILW